MLVEKVGVVLLAMFLKVWYTLKSCAILGYGQGIFVLNIMAAPGAGKTSLIWSNYIIIIWELSRKMAEFGWGDGG